MDGKEISFIKNSRDLILKKGSVRANSGAACGRASLGLQTRSGHPDTLPATIELAHGQRAVEVATKEHAYFLNMPIWQSPGFMTGKPLDAGFVPAGV
jgi:hypothetical protein